MSSNIPESPLHRRGHLQLAGTYTRDAWIPALPNAAERLEEILTSSDKLNREALLAEVKRDHAVSSALARTAIDEGIQFDVGLGTLRDLPAEQLRKLIRPRELAKSRHDFSSCTAIQSARFEDSIVSTSTAETLASAFQIEGELAHTCALLRQLGHSLLAWNYPHVFKRAFAVMKSGETIDTTIGKILGFTPTLLTLVMLRSEQAPPIIMRTLGDSWTSTTPTENDLRMVENLTALCRFGECLSRATSQNAYPSASTDWETAKHALETRIGRNGWRILEAELTWYLANYRYASNRGITVPKLVRELSEYARVSLGEVTLFERNAAAQHCAENTSRLLRNFYLRLASPEGKIAAVDFLVTQVINRCGFSRAAIFTRQNDLATLQPTFISAGTDPKEVASSTFIRTAIDHAAHAKSTVYGTEQSLSVPTKWVASVIGETQRAAVLYLEFAEGAQPEDQESKTTLKALQQAVGDGMALY